MILIVDDNEYRRNDISFELRRNKYMVNAISYDDIVLYQKPIMTVYIHPTSEFVNKLKRSDTLTVIAKSDETLKTPKWAHAITLNSSFIKEIINLYKENYKYEVPDNVDVIGVVCIKNTKVGVGGICIDFTKEQLKLLKLLLYNRGKEFNFYEILKYIPKRTNSYDNLLQTIRRMNHKTLEAKRGKILLINNEKCVVNPELAYYEAEE